MAAPIVKPPSHTMTSIFPVQQLIQTIGVLLSFLLVSCRTEPTVVIPAFYHWQTRLALTAEEAAYLDALDAERLYVKFFDVDWEPETGPVAQAQVEVDPAHLQALEIIPTVFITVETIAALDEAGIDDLAGKILDKLFYLAGQLPSSVAVPEVQVDCDWTEGTQLRFFRLLERLRPALQQRGLGLSATIRLHQVRYFERTGVPPVDRGMLMFYNVGEVGHWQAENSILPLATAAPYLEGFERYPLPLDVALPAFGWGVVFRAGRLVRLMNDLRATDLVDTSRFVKLAPGRFEVRKSTYLNGYYLYRGDRIRIEAADAPLLEKSAELLKPHFRGRQFYLAFYHLDTTTIKHLHHGALEAVIRKMEE